MTRKKTWTDSFADTPSCPFTAHNSSSFMSVFLQVIYILLHLLASLSPLLRLLFFFFFFCTQLLYSRLRLLFFRAVLPIDRLSLITNIAYLSNRFDGSIKRDCSIYISETHLTFHSLGRSLLDSLLFCDACSDHKPLKTVHSSIRRQ